MNEVRIGLFRSLCSLRR